MQTGVPAPSKEPSDGAGMGGWDVVIRGRVNLPPKDQFAGGLGFGGVRRSVG